MSTWVGVTSHIAVPVLLALAMNMAIWKLGWNGGGVQAYLPPGWVIGTVWTVLLALLGWIHWQVRGDFMVRLAIEILIAYCLLYPVLVALLARQWAKILDVIAFVLAYGVALVVAKRRWGSFKWLLPLLAWVTYVNLADALECGKRKKIVVF